MIDDTSLEKVARSWNKEFPQLKLSGEILKHALIDSPYTHPETSEVFYEDQRMVGLIAIKRGLQHSKDKRDAFIAFIYVCPEFRNKGYAKRWIQDALATMRASGIDRLWFGSDMDPLFPGVPKSAMNAFFDKHGIVHGKAYNMIRKRPFKDIRNPTPYDYDWLSRKDLPHLRQFIKKHFSSRWAQECLDYENRGGDGSNYLVVRSQDQIVGFARVNDADSPLAHNTVYRENYKKLAGIGPLGVHPKFRRQGIAKTMIQKATNQLFDEGASDVLIDWTGLKAFYETLGYEIEHAFYTVSYIDES